jgi:WD40 repeat protein
VYDPNNDSASFRAHHGPVECLAFNPAGDAFASGYAIVVFSLIDLSYHFSCLYCSATDATLRLWNWSPDIGAGSSSVVEEPKKA